MSVDCWCREIDL